MRILTTFFVTSLVVPGVFAQSLTSEQVPPAVIRGLHEKFPNIRSATWKLKSDGNYEAEFTRNRREIAAKFDPTGKWIETESAIPRAQLTAAVAATIARRFKGYQIVETQTVVRSDQARLIYEVHVANYVEIVKVQLYDDGTIVTQSTKQKAKP
jgi:ribosomal protein S26